MCSNEFLRFSSKDNLKDSSQFEREKPEVVTEKGSVSSEGKFMAMFWNFLGGKPASDRNRERLWEILWTIVTSVYKAVYPNDKYTNFLYPDSYPIFFIPVSVSNKSFALWLIRKLHSRSFERDSLETAHSLIYYPAMFSVHSIHSRWQM